MINLLHKAVEENAEEIAKIVKEVEEKFNAKQISASQDIVFRKYFDKIGELSDKNVMLDRYLSNTNIESGRYKITLRYKSIEDKQEVEKYLNI